MIKGGLEKKKKKRISDSDSNPNIDAAKVIKGGIQWERKSRGQEREWNVVRASLSLPFSSPSYHYH